ncbi:MAG: hypothetical protein Q9162_006260 [Coniocarpon cinnabarinum]
MVNIRTLTLSLLSPALALAVQSLTPDTFDATVFSGTPSLVEFFAPWCGHCKKLEPIYDELGDTYATSKSVQIAKVDGDAHKDLSSRYGVSGFPTIKWFDGKSKDPVDYSGGRDLDSFQKFIEDKTGVKAKKKLELPSEVVQLTDGDFKQTVGKDQDVLVAFTAPWCGHCKSLKPTWEKVAQDYAAETGVAIAQVDAEANKAVAQELGVSGYPTIKFFPKASTESESYSGARDENAFITFMNEKAGTHRTVGGGLDATAGTIKTLDDILVTYSGSNLDDVTKQVNKAVKDIKDAYAEYYVKVLNKLASNKDYVQKETNRLEKMLKKGGLARTKEDDLTSRVNILKQFAVGEKSFEEVKEEL